MILDLVFASGSPGFVVKTDDSPVRPVSDEIDVSPDGGWVRTHASSRGQGTDGNSVLSLGSDPIRVPVLLNRTITFLKPGHYEVTITTERLRNSEDMMRVTSIENCEPCRTTNSVGIDISEPDDSEEPALVASLARELDDTAKQPDNKPSPEQKELIDELQTQIQQSTGSTEADRKKQEALLQKLSEMANDKMSAIQKRTDVRRETALRLACLEGDDAVRAKVQFIATEEEYADPSISIAWILVDGLASSRNKQMQLDLLEEAWRNPQLLPTDPLQTALRQARELTQKDWVEEELWAGTHEERQAAFAEDQRETNEIIATLPLRSESNREQTIKFLKALGVPNPINQRPRLADQPK